MAPKIKITIRNWANNGIPTNVNNWFQTDVSLTNLGSHNFTAVINDDCLTIHWTHPNASIVRDLLIPVLKTAKQKISQNPEMFSLVSGVIDSDIELKDMDPVSTYSISSNPDLYPHSYQLQSLNVDLDSLIFNPKTKL